MATKQEIIEGLELTIAQAKRTTALFAQGEWDWKRAGGWTPKELYSHLAAVAGMIPGFSQAMLAASEDQDLLQGMDIDQMNAAAVGSMSSTTQNVLGLLYALETELIRNGFKAEKGAGVAAAARFLNADI